MLNIGLQQDSVRTERTNKSFETARNVILDSLKKITKNENGFDIIEAIEGTVIGGIALPNEVIVFSTYYDNPRWNPFEGELPPGQGPDYLIISRVTSSTITQILRTQFTKHLSFIDIDWIPGITLPYAQQPNWIEGVYSYNRDKELIIAFWNDVKSSSDRTCYLNVDNPQISIDPTTKELVDQNEIGLLYLSPDIKPPVFDLVSVDENGSLVSGVYQVAIAYKYKDGDYTSASYLSNPIFITNSDVNANIHQYDGCEPNTKCGKSFTINVKNIDTRFEYCKLIIINKNNGLYTASETIDFATLDRSEINFTYKGDGADSDLTDALIDTEIIDKVYAGTIHEDRLILMNTIQESEINYQKYANCIQVKWTRDVELGLDDVQGSHKDPIFVFKHKGFMPDETYAINIHAIINGRLTKGFHIPGRVKDNDEEINKLSDVPDATAEELKIHKDARKFYTRNSAWVDGHMGYWQNENETYPETSDFEYHNLKDDEGNTIPNQSNLAGTNVRHHRFPSINRIISMPDTKYLYPIGDLYDELDPIATANVSGNIKLTKQTLIDLVQNADGDNLEPEYIKNYTGVFSNFSGLNPTYFEPLILNTKGLSTPSNGGETRCDPTSRYSLFSFKERFPSHISGDPKQYVAKVNQNLITSTSDLSTDYCNAIKVKEAGIVKLSLSNFGVGVKMVNRNKTSFNSDWIDGKFYGYYYVRLAIIKITDTGLVNNGFDITTVSHEVIADNVRQIERKIQLEHAFESIYLDLTNKLINVNADETILFLRQVIAPDNAMSEVTFLDADVTLEYKQAKYNSTVYTKPLGIKLENVYIPSELRDKIQGFTISYAKRDINNATVLAQGAIIDHTSGYGDIDSGLFRFHGFDMLHGDKLNIHPNFLKVEAKVMHADSTYITQDDTLYANASPEKDAVRKISNSKFIPHDNSATTPVNTEREECFVGNIANFQIGDYSEDDDTNALLLANMCMFKQDIYRNFYDNLLVMTGHVCIFDAKSPNSFLNDAGFYMDESKNSIYGGDTVTNLHGVRTTKSDNTSDSYLIAVNSIAHIGYRHSNLIDKALYYPKHSLAEFTAIKDTLNEGKIDQTYLYNPDYSTLNDIKSPISKNPHIDDLVEYPYRIMRSIKTNRETNIVGWRNFRVGDYYEMPKNTGVGKNLKSMGNNLLIQMERALYIASVKDVIQGANLDAYMGRGDIFDREPIEMYDSEHGKIGCISKFGCALTPVGYITIDKDKIYLFDGQTVKVLNNYMNEFLIANLFDYNLPIGIADYDNPFIGYGLIANYNPYPGEEMILITKRNLNGSQFTLSFNMDAKNWYSFHDYLPDAMFALRSNMFSSYNNSIFNHNIGDKGIYYDQESIIPSYIDVVLNDSKDVVTLLESVKWATEVYQNGTEIYNASITHIMLYNDTQCSGLIPLNYDAEWYDYDETPRLVHNFWHFNSFRDAVLNNLTPFLDANYNPISANVNIDLKDYFEKSEFISNFIIARLYFDNTSGNEIFIKDITTKLRKDRR